MKRWRTKGSVAPEKFGGHKKHKLVAHADKVKRFVEETSDHTLAERQAGLEQAGMMVSLWGEIVC